ncbi:FAD-dependent monooxygenase [Ktedonospora formicarum]|uniref:FAD-dependent oxidoreductase n=1 Tax=Ktedonospora formicarum TaxID=2778364 RepID=A0A8J3MSC6_9CHLR|nr:FAD-dependent monooxygenase [Ktedonospora formicarum]GHO45970.1 FAD-dependent oxidoreductase [Ktedonospora formicarum]
MNNHRNILISGASIAGPALAYWLSRHGFSPTVVERTPTFREGGYKVDIRGVAVEVADRMGILNEIQQARTDMQESIFVDSSNKPIVTLPADFMGGRVGRDEEIMRGDLAHILYEHTRDTTEYIFGDTITSIQEDEDGVQVTFERGAPRRFDLIVGADGLHSQVRNLAFGDETQFTQSMGGYLAFFSLPNFLQLDRQEVYHGLPGKAASVYSMGKDAEAKCVFFFFSPTLNYDYRSVEQQRQILLDAFASDGWQIPRLLESARHANDFYFDAISLIQMDRWSTGRIALLGDAAYCASPASGQGTSLALVGAYVLAGELAEASGDYQEAFARYENEMRAYVEANQKFAINSIKNMIPRSRTQIWFQTQMMRLLPHLPWKGAFFEKITKEIQSAANAITLKEYQKASTETPSI